LSDHVLEVLQSDLKDVSLIMIDEVSMIFNLIFMYVYILKIVSNIRYH